MQGGRTLESITSRSTAGLTFDRRPDGTLSINLQGRFQHLLLAAAGQDGLGVECHTGDATPSAAVAAIRPWRPVRGGAVRPLDVSALRQRLPLLTVAPSAPEKQ